MQGEFSLGELAVRFGLALRGEPGLKVSRVATLSHAGSGALSFLANPRYRKQMESTRATAVLVGAGERGRLPGRRADRSQSLPGLCAHCGAAASAGAAARREFIRRAVVAPSARIAASASVGPLAVIEDDADIGERVFVGPGCIVQRGARIGAGSRLMSRVNVYAGVRIGQRCILHAGAVVGADGFGFAPDAGTWVKVPQVGSVQIGDDVEIGANTTIDRGAIDDTVVEHGVKLDNQIQVGHNVTIGAHTAIAGCVGISGSTTHRPALHDRRRRRYRRSFDDCRRCGGDRAAAW